MSECRGDYQKLPPGWDCKVDKTTGKCYYINYLTKAMQLEDPRKRYKQLQNEKSSTESIPMQPLHGSPYHVYPASTYPAVKAFQGPNSSLHHVSASPLLSSRMQTQLEMSPIARPSSPQTPRMGNLPRRQTIQETSFSNNIDTDAVVTKINNMFPTASENHIRLLLKKYYNREAVVISALQVEKHPVTMPGPFATPPSQRHLFHSNSSIGAQMTPPARRFDPMMSRTASPIPGRPASVASGLYGSPRFSPKPHSSPKMKLRYLKNIFPKADETLLLDILANADNNVQKASETLISMGYAKRDVIGAPKLSSRSEDKKPTEPVESSDEKIIPLHPKVLTEEEKESIKAVLQARYKTIAERIVLMALESVNYSEDRACQILHIVLQEDESKEKQKKKRTSEKASSKQEGTMKEEPEAISESINESDISKASPLTNTAKCILPPSSSSPPSKGHIEATVDRVTAKSINDKSIAYDDRSIYIPVFDSPCISATYHDPESPEPTPTNSTTTPSPPSSSSPLTSNSSIGHGEDVKKSRSKAKSDFTKSTPKTSDGDSPTVAQFQSILKRLTPNGPNPDLCKGPNEDLLLADYITWSGANPDISIGHKEIAHGADAKLLIDRSNSAARGHNADLCKGPQVGLAKGSIYSQINRSITANAEILVAAYVMRPLRSSYVTGLIVNSLLMQWYTCNIDLFRQSSGSFGCSELFVVDCSNNVI